MEEEKQKKSIWGKIKGLFLIAGAVAIAAKGTAALPAEHLVSKQEEQKNDDLKAKQAVIHKHKAIYPSRAKSQKCLPQNINHNPSRIVNFKQ